jgi:ribose transport system permease protein
VKKILGILGLLVVVCLLTTLVSDRFLTAYNVENVVRRTALFGILSIGAAFVIITSGIDLSIGSIVCLTGCMLPWLLVGQDMSPWLALPLLAVLSVGIGFAHGWFITKLKLQPFVVTLCGLLLYRGATRGIVADQSQGFRGEYEGLKWLAQGSVPLPGTDFGIPMPCVLLVVVALLAAVFLHRTVWGRYLKALGRNEEAARYSGIDTDKMVILAYVVCGLLSGLGGMLFVLDVGSAQPVDFGSFYELYAIAAAVLGGCSLRGGEGSVLGVIIGAALMQVLRNAIVLIDAIPNNIEFAIIGIVILAGVSADELVRRAVAARREPGPSGKATASMICGIVSLAGMCVVGPLVIPVAIVGLVLGIMSMKAANKNFAITGIVTSGIALLLSLLALAGLFSLLVLA